MTEATTNTIGVCQVTHVVSLNSFRLKKLKACSRLWRAEGWIGGGDGSDPEIEPRSARRRGADNRHSPPHGGSLPSHRSLREGSQKLKNSLSLHLRGTVRGGLQDTPPHRFISAPAGNRVKKLPGGLLGTDHPREVIYWRRTPLLDRLRGPFQCDIPVGSDLRYYSRGGEVDLQDRTVFRGIGQ